MKSNWYTSSYKQKSPDSAEADSGLLAKVAFIDTMHPTQGAIC